ncbi:MAG: transposase [Patescibacteria group bacterium]
MQHCPVCDLEKYQRRGKIKVEKMTKDGVKLLSYQAYRCINNHFFSENTSQTKFTNSFIEYSVILYLRSLSLNTTIDFLRIQYEQDVLSKQKLLEFIIVVADTLPTLDDIDNLFHPKRSGYLAFDGVWYKYRGLNFVLLVCFDPVTFDIVSYHISEKETFESYEKLIRSTLPKLKDVKIHGLYGDGDRGLIKALKLYFPNIPIQVCVVHKEFRLGQILPFKRAYTGKALEIAFKRKVRFFKETAETILYANNKNDAERQFEILKEFMTKEKDEKLKKAFGSLKYNFKYILTHFDYLDMERDNNIIEGFNSIIKRRLRLLKGFKRPANIDRYIKLVLLDYRFHGFVESRFVKRRNKTPLELSGVSIPKYYNFIKFLRESLNLSFETEKS